MTMHNDDDEITFCEAELTEAHRRLSELKGMRLLRGVPGGPLEDVTDQHREHEEKMVRYWEGRLKLAQGETD